MGCILKYYSMISYQKRRRDEKPSIDNLWYQRYRRLGLGCRAVCRNGVATMRKKSPIEMAENTLPPITNRTIVILSYITRNPSRLIIISAPSARPPVRPFYQSCNIIIYQPPHPALPYLGIAERRDEERMKKERHNA